MQFIKIIFLYALSTLCSTAIADTEQPSLNDFKRRINEGDRSREYSESLFSHKNLLDLVDEESERKDKEVEYSKVTGQSDPDKAPLPHHRNESKANDGNVSINIPDRSSKTKRLEEQESPQSLKTGTSPNLNIESSKIDENESKDDAAQTETSELSDPTKNKEIVLDPLLLSSGVPINNNMKLSSPTSIKVRFGITIGSTINVKLANGANNIQPGYVVFEVTTATKGYADVLPVKSLLFGKPKTVIGDDRLYVEVSKGITPNHDEFQLSAFVVGIDDKPGLIATVRNDGKSLRRASTETIFSAVGSITGTVTDSNIPLSSGKQGLRTLLKEKQDEIDNVNGTPAYIVEAETQYATLSVIETF